MVVPWLVAQPVVVSAGDAPLPSHSVGLLARMLRQNLHPVPLLGDAPRLHHLAPLGTRAATGRDSGRRGAHDARLLRLLLFHHALVLLQEVLEVGGDAQHARAERVDPRLHRLFVLRRRFSAHLLRGHLDLLLVDLDLGERVLDLDVQLRDLVFSGREEGAVFVDWDTEGKGAGQHCRGRSAPDRHERAGRGTYGG